MLSSGCNVHECRVLLPERVRIALCRLSAWGIRMELIRIAWRRGTFHIRNSVRRHFTSEYLTARWERRTFQLLRSDMSGSSDSAYPESIRSRQFRFPGQLGSSDTRDSRDPFPPTIKKQTLIILTTKSPFCTVQRNFS